MVTLSSAKAAVAATHVAAVIRYLQNTMMSPQKNNEITLQMQSVLLQILLSLKNKANQNLKIRINRNPSATGQYQRQPRRMASRARRNSPDAISIGIQQK
jgi:hypothetical protein